MDMATIFIMDWIIDHVNSQEEAVYLKKPLGGVVRKISVPGAVTACLDHGLLMIRASTGYIWEVDPDSGHRKRRAVPNATGAELAF